MSQASFVVTTLTWTRQSSDTGAQCTRHIVVWQPFTMAAMDNLAAPSDSRVTLVARNVIPLFRASIFAGSVDIVLIISSLTVERVVTTFPLVVPRKSLMFSKN